MIEASDARGAEEGQARYAVLRDADALAWLRKRVRARFDVPDGTSMDLLFPKSGLRTPIAVARWDGDGVVVKVFRRPRAFLRTAWQLQHLHARGLPVPRLHAWSIRSYFSPLRGYLMIEQYVAGDTIRGVAEERRPDALARIARALATLHECRRRWHGHIFLPRPGSYARFCLPLVLARLGRLERFADAHRIAELRATLARRARETAQPDAYSLLHGHVNHGNFIVGEREAVLIDTASAHYGDPARDLVRAFHRLCRGAEEAAHFQDAYLAGRTGTAQEQLARSEPLYACDYVIRLTARQVRAARRDPTVDEAEPRARVARRLELCSRLLDAAGSRFRELMAEL